jgi:hypothetical protein
VWLVAMVASYPNREVSQVGANASPTYSDVPSVLASAWFLVFVGSSLLHLPLPSTLNIFIRHFLPSVPTTFYTASYPEISHTNLRSLTALITGHRHLAQSPHHIVVLHQFPTIDLPQHVVTPLEITGAHRTP